MKTLDPNQIFMSLSNIILQGGIASGTFVNIEFESDLYEDDAGSDGEVMRVRTNDKRANITFTLQITSEANTLLSALYNLDALAENGAGVGVLLIEDLLGGSRFFAEHAWIKKFPSVEYGNEPKTVEWEVRAAKLETALLGN